MAGSFALDLTKFAIKARGNIDLVVQKATFDVFKSVIMRTPVDTGRARANWSASANSYTQKIYEVTDKAGAQTANKMASIALGTKAGNVTYLINNLPYAQRLEYGYSKQAPSGMVRITIVEYQQHINNAVSSLR